MGIRSRQLDTRKGWANSYKPKNRLVPPRLGLYRISVPAASLPYPSLASKGGHELSHFGLFHPMKRSVPFAGGRLRASPTVAGRKSARRTITKIWDLPRYRADRPRKLTRLVTHWGEAPCASNNNLVGVISGWFRRPGRCRPDREPPPGRGRWPAGAGRRLPWPFRFPGDRPWRAGRTGCGGFWR